MFYYLYEIRNNLNGKIYVGVHKTKVMDDGYMGSGKVIRSAIEKYGIENFTKTILETFDDSKSMYAREAELVTDEFLLREDVYNLRRGGFGGFEYINNDVMARVAKNMKARASANESMRRSLGEDWARIIGQLGGRNAHTTEARLKRKNTCEKNGVKYDTSNMITPDANAKRVNTFRVICHQQGEKNSSFGTMWITNEIESKKVDKKTHIPDGWRRGRVIKS